MSRRVRLQLCTSTGHALGTLPEFTVATRWWPDVEPVVRAAKDLFGVDLFVLRLVAADHPSSTMGGSVTYTAELLAPPPPEVPLSPPANEQAMDDHPLRAPWARPGGIAAILAWADDVLAAAGRPRTGPAEQVKTWNLSSILRLPTAAGDVWCKSVPSFLRHEAAILQMVALDMPWLVPPVIGADTGRATVLLSHVAGQDQWEAPEGRLMEMVHRLVTLQVRWTDRVDALVTAGLPDWGRTAFPAAVRALLERPMVWRELSVAEGQALDELAKELPERLRDLETCGLPDTLVHGDFHPGNWRFGDGSLVLLDWGDSGVGNPMLDAAAFLPRIAPGVRTRVRDAWLDEWRRQRPDADVGRATRLAAPMAALRLAVVYQRFLEGIEPSERRYHRKDVTASLRSAVAASAAHPS